MRVSGYRITWYFITDDFGRVVFCQEHANQDVGFYKLITHV
jgi:hypothetical protein